MTSKTVLSLVLGIKRLSFRANDPKRRAADNEYQAKRPAALRRQAYTCNACQYRDGPEGEAQIHHANDNHHDNSDGNLLCACVLCHAYQHVGEPSKAGSPLGEGLSGQTLVAHIPEISPADLNHLQRALGAAMLDESSQAMARRIHQRLAARAQTVQSAMQSNLPADFAAAMAQLKADEYARRGPVVESLRLIFNATFLRQRGARFAAAFRAMPVSSWGSVAAQHLQGPSAAPDSPNHKEVHATE